MVRIVCPRCNRPGWLVRKPKGVYCKHAGAPRTSPGRIWCYLDKEMREQITYLEPLEKYPSELGSAGQKLIGEWLASNKISYVSCQAILKGEKPTFLTPNQVLVIRRLLRDAKEGRPDFLALFEGEPTLLEAKSGAGRLSQVQQKFIAIAESAGLRVRVVRLDWTISGIEPPQIEQPPSLLQRLKRVL